MNDTILGCLQLRYNAGVLEQELRIQGDAGIRTEWVPVPGNAPDVGRNLRYKEMFKDVDWTKSDTQIAREVGCIIPTVRNYRMRAMLPAPKKETRYNRKFDPDAFSESDWMFETDVMLAKRARVTRERIRQVRAEKNKPACVFHQKSKKLVAMMRWLVEHRSEVTGKPLPDVVRMIPGESDTPARIRAIRAVNIEVVETRYRGSGPANISSQRNWELPNVILALIWNISPTTVPNIRCQKLLPPPKFDIRYGKGDMRTPALTAAILAEVEKAKANGCNPDMQALAHYMDPNTTLKQELTYEI